MKIFILKPSSLGDVVQALPVLRLLKLHWPASEIYWWLDSTLCPLLEDDPDLVAVVPFPRNRWSSPRYWPEAWQSMRSIRAHRFDLVIDLQSLFRSGLVAWLANGARTIGLDDPREGARAFYDVTVPRASAETHAVDWYLSVLPHLGVPVHAHFGWFPLRANVAAKIRQKFQTNIARWVVLQPGARWENKRWPIEYFVTVARLLTKTHDNVRCVVLGGADDASLGKRIAAANPERILDLTGQSSLPEMVEWIRLSECMVTNDTGPMHVAAALAKPVIATFGPTNPNRTGPYGQLQNVLQRRGELPCVPCMKSVCRWPEPMACLTGIQPAEVFRKLDRLLGGA
ncbi:MAG TPA: lipopolysaccharide heptosyltransferase II [Verrucomicrobiae bacterium]